jgi:hypothetical protein
MSWRKTTVFGASIILIASLLFLWRLAWSFANVLLDQTVSLSGDLVARMSLSVDDTLVHAKGDSTVHENTWRMRDAA